MTHCLDMRFAVQPTFLQENRPHDCSRRRVSHGDGGIGSRLTLYGNNNNNENHPSRSRHLQQHGSAWYILCSIAVVIIDHRSSTINTAPEEVL